MSPSLSYASGYGQDQDHHYHLGQTLFTVGRHTISARIVADKTFTAPAQSAVEYETVIFNSDFPEDQ